MRKIDGSIVAVVAVAAAVLAGAACTGGSSGSTAKFGDTECADCIGTACSSEIAACTALGDCADALECTLDCPEEENALDTDCVETDCTPLVTTSAGSTAFGAVISCYLDESPSAGTCGSQCAPPTE